MFSWHTWLYSQKLHLINLFYNLNKQEYFQVEGLLVSQQLVYVLDLRITTLNTWRSEKKALVNSFIYVNFNYSQLVWYFSPCDSIRKIEKILKSLRIVLDDYESNCGILFRKSDKVTMELNPLQPGVAFPYSLKTSENLKVFWCFQGV